MGKTILVIILVNLIMHVFYFFLINLTLRNYFFKTHLPYEFISSYFLTSIFITFYLLFSFIFLNKFPHLKMIFIYFFSLSTYFIYDTLIKPYTIIFLNSKNRSQRFEKVLKKYNFEYKVFISKSVNENAYAMGLLTKGKIILITEGLVNKLSAENIEAILLHEIGHHEKKHIFFYFKNMIIFNICFALILIFVPIIIFKYFKISIEPLHTPFILGIYGYLAYYLMYIKKDKEYEADLYAANIIGKNKLIEALNNFNKITFGKLEKKSITHPILSKRIKYVEKSI